MRYLNFSMIRRRLTFLLAVSASTIILPGQSERVDSEVTLFFAQFGEGTAQLMSQIILFNLEGQEAQVEIDLRRPDGSPLVVDLNGSIVEGRMEFSLPPWASRVLRTDGDGEPTAGTVTVTSNRHLSGVVLFGGALGVAGVGSSSQPLRGFRTPVKLRTNERIDTGIAIMNLEKRDLKLDFNLIDPNGRVVAQATWEGENMLPALGHRALFIGQINWNPSIQLSNFEGTVQVIASGLIAGTALQTRPGELATMPVTSTETFRREGAKHTLNFAHFGEGDGELFSELILFNLEEREAQVTVSLHRPDGGPMTIDLNGEVVEGIKDFYIPPLGSQVLRTDGLGQLLAGTVTATSDCHLSGVVLFGGDVGVAGVGSSSRALRAFRTPIKVRHSDGVTTGIAVMNNEDRDLQLELRLNSAGGDEVGQTSFSGEQRLRARGQITFFVDQINWDGGVDLSDFEGTLEVAATGEIFATVIHARPKQFATLPASALPPRISAFSPGAVPPGGEVEVLGTGFADDGHPSDLQRNQVFVKLEDGTSLELRPRYISPQRLVISIPPIPAIRGGWLLGPVQLCVTVDELGSCHPKPLMIEPLAVSPLPTGELLLRMAHQLTDPLLESLQQQKDSATAVALATLIEERRLALRQLISDALSGTPQRREVTLGTGQTDTFFYNEEFITFVESLLAAASVDESSQSTAQLLGLGCLTEELRSKMRAYERLRFVQDQARLLFALYAESVITGFLLCQTAPLGCPTLAAVVGVLDFVLLDLAGAAFLATELWLKYNQDNTLRYLRSEPPRPEVGIGAEKNQGYRILAGFGPYGDSIEGQAEIVRLLVIRLFAEVIGTRLTKKLQAEFPPVIQFAVNAVEKVLEERGINLNIPVTTTEIEIGAFALNFDSLDNTFARLSVPCPPSEGFIIGKESTKGDRTFFTFRPKPDTFISVAPPASLAVKVVDPPEIRIIAPTEYVLSVANSIYFAGEVLDEGEHTIKSILWTSSLDGLLNLGSLAFTSRLSRPGDQSIVLSVTNTFEEMGSVRLLVCVADLPEARPDAVATQADEAIVVDVLHNDDERNACGLNPLLHVAVVDSSNTTGIVRRSSDDPDLLVYDPAGKFNDLPAGEIATDSFRYSVPCGDGCLSTVTVTITIYGFDEVIRIADPVLETAVREIRRYLLGIPLAEPITKSHALHFGRLKVEDAGVHDLGGLEHFVYLHDLDLSGNQISELDPLSDLTGLERIDLSENEIYDLTPLASLTLLTDLDVSTNLIPDIAALESLSIENLYLDDNEIEDLGPLTGMSTLQALSVNRNRIGEITALAGLTSLLDLEFSENQITDVGPLSGLRNLRWLSASSNAISDLSPIAELSRMEYLELERNSISELSPLSALKNLRTLRLSRNKISDIEPLASLTNLTGVHLDYNTVSDMQPLTGLAALHTLDLTGNDISFFLPLRAVGNLTFLSIAGNAISDLSVLTGANQLVSLRAGFNQISDLSPLRGLARLGTLRLAKNPISDINPLEGMPQLAVLDISHTNVSDISILPSIPKLHSLDLYNDPVEDLAPLLQVKGFEGYCCSKVTIYGVLERMPEEERKRNCSFVEKLLKVPVDVGFLCENCNFLSKKEAVFEASGGTDRFFVDSIDGCAWQAGTRSDWIAVNAPEGSVDGDGSVRYQVAPNESELMRTGRVAIDIRNHLSVTQRGKQPK